jgi:protein dithiol oxidoreductase (disulfide-forming)
MRRLLGLTALLVLGLSSCTSCSRHAAPPTPTAPAPASAPAPGPAAAAPSTPPSTAPTPQSETEQAISAQESGDGAVNEKPESSDLSLERMATLPADAQLPGGRWKPGVNYDPVVPEQPTSVEPGKVEVIEFMWLGCPHCYALEPTILTWLKDKPAYIVFVRVPVVWDLPHHAHARLFYTLTTLGRPELVEKAFDTIQLQRNPLIGASEEESLRIGQAWAVQQGVSAADFAGAWNSETVHAQLLRAEDLVLRYRVQTVPSVVINGKYKTDAIKAGSAANLIQLIDDLSASEHRH